LQETEIFMITPPNHYGTYIFVFILQELTLCSDYEVVFKCKWR